MDDAIHRAGQEAARHGVPISACPFMKATNMPGHTGEAVCSWQAKLEAWEAGWRQESKARHAELQRRKSLRYQD